MSKPYPKFTLTDMLVEIKESIINLFKTKKANGQ